MKKTCAFLFSFILCLCIAYTQILGVCAVEVNMKQAAVGDVITYELHAGNCPKNVVAVGVSIYYDSAALQYVEDSIKIPNLSGYLFNTDLEGEIRFNVADLDGFDFQADKILAELQFTVISDYNPYPKLSYEVQDFLDADLTNHLDTYVYDLTYVDYELESMEAISSRLQSEADVKSSVSSTPVSSKTADLNSNEEGARDSDKVISSESGTDGNYSIMTETESLYAGTEDTPDAVDGGLNKQNGLSFMYIIIPAVVGILILAVSFIIVKLKSKGNHIS